MLLKNVLDIDPKAPEIKDLADIASNFGLSEMSEVVSQSVSIMPQIGKTVALVIGDENASEIISTLLAMAAMNYAAWKYEFFTVIMPEVSSEEIAFPRTATSDNHKKYADGYVLQAKNLIEKYFPVNPAE